MRIAHVITGLATGGAEVMLYNLLGKLDAQLFEPAVVSLMDIGPVGEKIQALNIPVHALGMSRGVPNPCAVVRLATWLRSTVPTSCIPGCIMPICLVELQRSSRAAFRSCGLFTTARSSGTRAKRPRSGQRRRVPVYPDCWRIGSSVVPRWHASFTSSWVMLVTR